LICIHFFSPVLKKSTIFLLKFDGFVCGERDVDFDAFQIAEIMEQYCDSQVLDYHNIEKLKKDLNKNCQVSKIYRFE